MRYRLRFRSLARGDVLRARKWYEREASHMVQAFLDELRSLVTSIGENPLMYPKVFDEVRRALMTRFSYAVYFTVDHESS
jgi:plasmid stabilization system protein ParE